MLNDIGVAVVGAWAAVWTQGSPYIEIYPGGYFAAHRTPILDGARLGVSHAGSVECLNVGGDMDRNPDVDGILRERSGDLNGYVSGRLTDWVAEHGETFADALKYGRKEV